MIKGFNNANVYLQDVGVVKKTIVVEEGKIAKILDEEVIGLDSLDDNLIVVPGFIDEHIHGANNSDCMYPETKHLANIAKTIAKEGVTCFLATTMTQSIDNIKKALNNVKEYMNSNNSSGAEVLGAHLEGPFISKYYKGAQGEQWIIPCSVKQFQEFEKASGYSIREVTLAYENDGLELVHYLKEKGIVASLGHTASTYEQANEGIKEGISCATHTYNAMQGFTNRAPGTVGAVLTNSDCKCEVICDLVHVSPCAINMLVKCKGKDNIIAITDGIEAKHLPDGKYALGGQDVFVKGKEARLADGTLAGSTLKMNDALKNFSSVTDLSFTDVIDLCTKNPAKNLGIYDYKGGIKIGKDADFAIIDKDFNVYKTINKGNVIYEK